MVKKYAMFGVGGFVARRHVEAIYKTGGKLIGAIDPFTSVGYLDSFDKDIEFFTKEEEFKDFCIDNKPDYVVVCTPNYLHKEHTLFGLYSGTEVICEKPLVLFPSDLEELKNAELATGKKVNTILQLRLNPILLQLKQLSDSYSIHNKVQILYHTPRGKWYYKTWKAKRELSGDLITNIGIHLLDCCSWLWGSTKDISLETKTNKQVVGNLFLEKADIHFDLGIDGSKEPKRLMTINDDIKIEFSIGFENAHVKSYEEILKGNGFGLVDTIPSIILSDKIRKVEISCQ